MPRKSLTRFIHSSKGFPCFSGAAKGPDTGDSDLDLLVAGHYNEKEVKQIGKKYNIEINIRIFPEEVFVGIDPQDALLIEAKNHHIVWKNAEAFVRAVIS